MTFASLLQHNREFYGFIRNGVPVEWRDPKGETRHGRAQGHRLSQSRRTTASSLCAS